MTCRPVDSLAFITATLVAGVATKTCSKSTMVSGTFNVKPRANLFSWGIRRLYRPLASSAARHAASKDMVFCKITLSQRLRVLLQLCKEYQKYNHQIKEKTRPNLRSWASIDIYGFSRMTGEWDRPSSCGLGPAGFIDALVQARPSAGDPSVPMYTKFAALAGLVK